MTNPGKMVDVLLVEDNVADVRLTQEAFKEAKVINSLYVARDGVEGLAFLRGEGEFAGAPRPDLVLLDLNLPRKNGRQVLAEIKSDPALMRIPVVVLTTSSAERDVVESYDLHANSYICKPVELESFLSVVRSLENFWLSVVRLPPW
jgi:CheY-like chemotaxis protein